MFADADTALRKGSHGLRRGATQRPKVEFSRLVRGKDTGVVVGVTDYDRYSKARRDKSAAVLCRGIWQT